MKKLASLCLFLFLLCGLAVPVRASEGEPAPPPDTGPIETRMETIGETPYITRTYRLPEGIGLDEVSSSHYGSVDFEQDGYLFTLSDTHTHCDPDTVLQRDASKTKTLYLEEDDVALALEQAEPDIAYEEDGWSGRLYLVEDSVSIRAAGDGGAKQAARKGSAGIKTLLLPPAGRIITLDGVIHDEVEGFIATLRYEGSVEKTIPGTAYVDVIFRGEKMVQQRSIPPLSLIACLLCVMAVLAIAAMAILTKNKGRRKAAAANFNTKDIEVEKIRQAAEERYEKSLREPEEPAILSAPEVPDLGRPVMPAKESEVEEDPDDSDRIGDGYYYGR